MRSESAGESILVLRITSFNIIIGNCVKEVALIVVHLFINSTTRGQSLMAVGIRWVIVASTTPIGLECFLDDLMAHEGDIKPAPCLMHGLGSVKIIVGYVKLILYLFFLCHTILIALRAKLGIISEISKK